MDNTSSISVGTYNILHPYSQNDFGFLPSLGKDWDSRVGIIVSNILNSYQDIFCLQEVSLDNFEDLKKRIGNFYEGFHTKHTGEPQGKAFNKPDGVAIFYLKKRFDRKIVRTCPSSNERSTTARRDLYVDLEDRITKRIIRFASAHFEGGSQRENGNQQLKQFIGYITKNYPDQQYPLDGIGFGCDLNEESDGERFKILDQANFKTADIDPQAETEIDRKRQIDWVFFRSLNTGLVLDRQGKVHTELPPGSDHRIFGIKIMDLDPKVPEDVVMHNSPSSIDSDTPNQQKLSARFPQTQWEKFGNKMSAVFSARNALWLLPASLLSMGLIPIAITISFLFYYVICRQ